MRGIKRPCRLLVVEYYSVNDYIFVGNSVSQHESITAAEKELKLRKESGIAVCFSAIIPDKNKENDHD